MTAVVLLGHGSPDPRAAADLRAVARAVTRRRPDLRVDVAFLDHDDPALTAAVRELADDGHTTVTVVPAFLTTAFHVRTDVPRAVAAAQASVGVALTVTNPLGPDDALEELLDARVPADHAVVLATAGTRDSAAQASLRAVAASWAQRRGTEVVVAYAAMAEPDVSTAIAVLRTRHAKVAVASYVLLRGVLPDRISAAADAAGAPWTEPFGTSVVDVVLARIDAVEQSDVQQAG